MHAFSLRESAPAGLVVDVLVRPTVAFAKLRAGAVAKTLGTARIPVASIAHLIALKTGTGRSIDRVDIEQLQSLQGSNAQ